MSKEKKSLFGKIGHSVEKLFEEAEEKNSDKVSQATTESTEKEMPVSAETIASPMQGQIAQLSDIDDEVFASGTMGEGIAIEPSEDKLFAPADGVATLVFPTGHAVGMKTNHGAEILMHIGMDTVELNGKYFTVHVKQDEVIQKGQLLVEFDSVKIKEAGYSVVTPIVITNSKEYQSIVPVETEKVEVGDKLIDLTV